MKTKFAFKYFSFLLNTRELKILYWKKNGLVSKVKRGKKENIFVVGRIRTCAGRPQWISSPSP